MSTTLELAAQEGLALLDFAANTTRCGWSDLIINQCAHCLGHDHTWVLDALDEIHFDNKVVEH